MSECIINVIHAIPNLNLAAILASIEMAIHKVDPVVIVRRVVRDGIIHAAKDLQVHAGRDMESESSPRRPFVLEANDAKISAGPLVSDLGANSVETVTGTTNPTFCEKNHVIVGEKEIIAAVVVGVLCEDVPNGIDSAVEPVQGGENKVDDILFEALAVQNGLGLLLKLAPETRLAKDGVVGIMTVVDAKLKLALLAFRDGVGKGPHEGAKGDMITRILVCPLVLPCGQGGLQDAKVISKQTSVAHGGGVGGGGETLADDGVFLQKSGCGGCVVGLCGADCLLVGVRGGVGEL